MQVSHSRVETFESCPFKYKLRYKDKIQTIKADNADNALFLGTALHTGLEKNIETAIKEYYMQYPVITDDHVNEAIKLELLIPKAKKLMPKGLNEVEISDDDFKGFIDLLVPVKSETKLGGEYQELPGVYTSYILGENSIILDDIGDEVPYEMSRDAKINGGQDTLYVRDRYICGVDGISFEKPASITASASNADLETGTNWNIINDEKKAIPHKAIALCKVVSRG